MRWTDGGKREEVIIGIRGDMKSGIEVVNTLERDGDVEGEKALSARGFLGKQAFLAVTVSPSASAFHLIPDH